MKFNSSMLRERFVIHKTAPPDPEGPPPAPITAASIRFPLTLQAGNLPPENLVVRAHNMHCGVRLVGKILLEYDKYGPVLNRTINWAELWDECLSPYERAYAPHHWAALYHRGKPLFAFGEHHPFLDVIEKCDTLQKGNYENSIKMARDALKTAGGDSDITYDSTVALVANLEKSTARCGMVIRNADSTNNFNISIQETATSGKINIALGLSVSAAFLEGVQLGFFIGQQKAKLSQGLIQRFSREDKNTREARERLTALAAEIDGAENRYTVRYRPERPNFLEIIQISERIFRASQTYT